MDVQTFWLGAVADASGHADELRGFLRAQERAGDRPLVKALRWTTTASALSPDDAALLQRLEGRRADGPVVAVHEYLPGPEQIALEGRVNVARVMFETDRLPAGWLAPLMDRDELWVTCEHNIEAFAASGIPRSKMRLLGGTLDFDLFDPALAHAPVVERDEERFTFLTNFDFSARKGWESLLRAWGRAFSPDAPVRLLLKTGSFYTSADEVRGRIDALVEGELGGRVAPVQLITDHFTSDRMPGLYAAADAYVLASRGEGWGRPYMEAMAMGLPTIASNWSGNLAFMDPDTTWLVDGSLVPVPEDALLFNGLYRGHRWFDPDVDALAQAMRDVARDPAVSRARAAAGRARVIERFGPDATAARLRELTRDAHERYGDPSRGIVVRGRFGATESLAVVNEGLTGALHAQGLPVRHAMPGSGQQPVPTVGITHGWPPELRPVTEGPLVAVLPWEYGAPPAEWVAAARGSLDRVWVPSAYVRDVHVAAGMPPGVVEVVPNGVDLEAFTPDGPARELPAQAGTTFLFVGGAIWRKGIDLLLRAWADAFGPGDDVQLVVKAFGGASWYQGQDAGAAIRDLAARTDVAPVHLLDEDLPAVELPALYRAADVLVAPYRGEGFCLPALEALACGVPVVHPSAGPTREFVPDAASWVVEADRVEVEDVSQLPPLAGAAWVHEVRHEALVAALRDAARPAARAPRAAAARPAAEAHGWTAAGAVARASLDRLTAEAQVPAREQGQRAQDARARQVLLHADWADEGTWGPLLDAWVAAVGPEEDVTLVLALPEAGLAELAGAVEARLALAGDALPDLAVVPVGAEGPLGLVAAADAVLVAGDARPEGVLRRARELVRAEDLTVIARSAVAAL